MHINKPSVANIEAADRVNLVHSTIYESEENLVKCVYPCPDMSIS